MPSAFQRPSTSAKFNAPLGTAIVASANTAHRLPIAGITVLPYLDSTRRGPLVARIEGIGRLCLFGVVVWLTLTIGLAALRSAAGLDRLPAQLTALDHRLPVLFRVHMGACGLALLLLPWVLLRRGGNLHRWLGRLAAASMFIGVAAALPSALASVASPIARLGFLTQGLLCFSLLGGAVHAIATGRMCRHKRLMAAVVALMSGAIVLRLMLAAVALLHLRFQPAYAVIAWISWALPLVLVWRWTGSRQGRAGRAPAARAYAT